MLIKKQEEYYCLLCGWSRRGRRCDQPWEPLRNRSVTSPVAPDIVVLIFFSSSVKEFNPLNCIDNIVCPRWMMVAKMMSVDVIVAMMLNS